MERWIICAALRLAECVYDGTSLPGVAAEDTADTLLYSQWARWNFACSPAGRLATLLTSFWLVFRLLFRKSELAIMDEVSATLALPWLMPAAPKPSPPLSPTPLPPTIVIRLKDNVNIKQKHKNGSVGKLQVRKISWRILSFATQTETQHYTSSAYCSTLTSTAITTSISAACLYVSHPAPLGVSLCQLQ